jgi:predicted MFS family arabinose efflux permease
VNCGSPESNTCNQFFRFLSTGSTFEASLNDTKSTESNLKNAMGKPANNTLSKLSRGELELLLVLACVQFTHIMDFMILMPLGPQLMRLFSITPAQFGLIVSAYQITAGVCGFLIAFFIDRFDRKSALLFAYVGFAIGTLACAFAPDYRFLLAARALAGAFGGGLGGLIMSIVGDTIPIERRGRAMGITMASFSAAAVFGVPFGLALANHFSWHAPFLFVAGLASLNTLLIVARVPELKGHLKNGYKSVNPIRMLASVAADQNQTRALMFMVLLMMSQFALIPFISQYMVANVGFREAQLPLIYLIGGGLTIFTSPLVGRLADRMGKPKVFRIAGFLVIIPYLLISNMPPVPIYYALTATSLFFIIGNARFIPAMAMITASVGTETRGSFMSLVSSVQSLSSGLATFIAGLVIHKSVESSALIGYNLVGFGAVALSLVALYAGAKLASGATTIH